MKIQQTDLTVRDLVADYRDDGEGGAVGYGGKLDMRVLIQRDYIYQMRNREKS